MARRTEYDASQAAKRLKVPAAAIRWARHTGLIPAPDFSPWQWSRATSETTGLHLVDLHLRENAACGECRRPHLHVCHRWGNPNRAAAKMKPDWRMTGGVISGGEIYRVSPAMISSYFEYMTTEYAKYAAGHGMLLIQLSGPNLGEPWSADAARGMLRRAGRQAGLPGRIKPHAFRHTFTSAVLDASGNDPFVAKEAGNWASAQTVDEVYGHPDQHSPEFIHALRMVWGEEE